MKKTGIQWAAAVACTFLLVWPARQLVAQESYYESSCKGCHGTGPGGSVAPNTCAGCHAMGVCSDVGCGRVNLTATTDKPDGKYCPGAPITITVTGGNENAGWMRAILYNEKGEEVARKTGPNHKGWGPDTYFPIRFTFSAPVAAGTYAYEVAWYGNISQGTQPASVIPDPNRPGHGSLKVKVSPVITVVAAQAVAKKQ